MKHIIKTLFLVGILLAQVVSAQQQEKTKPLITFPVPIPDGGVVVLKKGDNVGIAILKKQTTKPEQFSYDWFLRTDGRIDFRAGVEGLKAGSNENVSYISFGPFNSQWSANRNGRGFIYLDPDYFTGMIIDPNMDDLNHELWSVTMIKQASTQCITIAELDIKYLIPIGATSSNQKLEPTVKTPVE